MAQTQTCVQELTNEVKNRCLELREMSLRINDEEKLLQVNTDQKRFNQKSHYFMSRCIFVVNPAEGVLGSTHIYTRNSYIFVLEKSML